MGPAVQRLRPSHAKNVAGNIANRWGDAEKKFLSPIDAIGKAGKRKDEPKQAETCKSGLNPP
jgi:hypothetical protein